MSCTLSDETIARIVEFHGHSCPGLAIGIRASELAIRELGSPDKADMVVVTECDMCGVDAIQCLTGCTFGKGNLIHRDYGKMAFSFYDRRSGKGVRMVLNKAAMEGAEGTTSAEGMTAEGLKLAKRERCMTVPLDELFSMTELQAGPPRPAKSLESLICADCGESVMESRARRYEGRTLCIPCFQAVEQKMC